MVDESPLRSSAMSSPSTILAIAIVISAIILSSSILLAAGNITKSLDALRLPPGAAVPPVLAGAPQPGTGGAAQQQATATPSGALAASAGTKPNLQGHAALGSASAKVQVVEFSDFQCPFCRKAFVDSLPAVESGYVATGKVAAYWKDFPLPFHPDAPKMAEAARCAGDQGKFWEMHDALFNAQVAKNPKTDPQYSTLKTVSLSVDEAKAVAANVSGLNTETFNSCLDGGSKAAGVQTDLAEGSSLGVGGTPTFFLIGGSYDRLNLAGIKSTIDAYGIEVSKASDGTAIFKLVGALPSDAFTKVLDAQLAAS